jgi:hypothetical protein
LESYVVQSEQDKPQMKLIDDVINEIPSVPVKHTNFNNSTSNTNNKLKNSAKDKNLLNTDIDEFLNEQNKNC